MENQERIKFGKRFPELQGIDLELEAMDFSVRAYNYLKRADIHNLKTLLNFSLDDLMQTGHRNYTEVIEKLEYIKEEQIMSASNLSTKIRTYSDAEAAKALDDLDLRQFKIIKSHYHRIQPIRYRAVHGFNVDGSELEIIRKAIAIKKHGVKSWEAAFKLALDAPAALSETGDNAAHLAEILLVGDGSSDELAASLLQEQCECYPQFVESATAFSDCLRENGSTDLSRALNSFCDTFAKAAAFDMLHRNDLLPKAQI